MRGYEVINELLDGLKEYMKDKGYNNVAQFRGKVCKRIKGTNDIDREHKYVAEIKEKLAPCRYECPIDNKAQAYIWLISQKRFKEAAEIIRENNPLPSICGRVCHHPCETNCTRSRLEGSLSIRALKRFAIENEGDNVKGKKIPADKRKEKVAVIGAGPAGLTCANALSLMGYQVTIFEKNSEAGGMMIEGIPVFKLPRDIIKKDIKNLLNENIEMKLNIAIGKDITFEEIKKNYDAVFIASGAGISREMGVKGEEKDNVLSSIEFLKKVNSGQKVELGKNVAIIGGGNSAVDAARSAIRIGAEKVYMVYRRTRNEMPATDEELNQAEKEGIKILYLVTPVEIKGGSLLCKNLTLGDKGKDNRRKPEEIEATNFELKVDNVISAIGEVPDLSFTNNNINIKNSLISTDNMAMTNCKGVFAGGDAVTGPNMIIDAIAAGQRAARSIETYIKGEKSKPELKKEQIDIKRILKEDIEERIKMQEPGARSQKPEDKDKSFKEVYLTYSENDAIKEAKRCLACGCGLGCGNCKKVCIYFAIDDKNAAFNVDNEKCDGCGLCVQICPNGSVEMVEKKKG
jgi:putative selenate reductase YgfK subunit